MASLRSLPSGRKRAVRARDAPAAPLCPLASRACGLQARSHRAARRPPTPADRPRPPTAHAGAFAVKWHQNNPYRSNINDPIAQIANAGARNWFLDLTAGSGGLPPNREDLAALPVPPPLATDALPNLPENGGYQIICKPVDKQFKIGLREEWEEGWQGGCPDDMDKCQIQEPVAAYPLNTNAGLDRVSPPPPPPRRPACMLAAICPGRPASTPSAPARAIATSAATQPPPATTA